MILVTGGTGLVGAHILYALVTAGYSVRAMCRKSSSKSDVLAIFRHYNAEDGKALFDKIAWTEGYLEDIDDVEQAMQGCAQVYHAGGKVSFRKKDYAQLLAVNRNGTRNVVNCALAQGVEKFGFVSSTAAIGRPDSGCADEDDYWKPDAQHSNYSFTKYAAEMEVWRAASEGLNVSIVNPSIILGPGDWSRSSTRIFQTINKGLSYYPSGSNAFVDVRDVSGLLIHLMENNYFGERYLSIGENCSFKYLFDVMAEAFEVTPPQKLLPEWIAGLAWRLESFRTFFTGTEPRITKESTRSSFSDVCYDATKAKNTGYEFHPVVPAVKNAVIYF